MSHFSVLVVTDEYPSKEVIAKALQPYHEFECTGIDDEFVQDIDKTEELRGIYETRSETRLRDASGGLHLPYEDRFYRDPTVEEAVKIGPVAGTGCSHGIAWSSKDWNDGRGYRAKVRFIPDGFEEITIPAKEVLSFAYFIKVWNGMKAVPFGTEPNIANEHKYGYVLVDEAGEVLKVIDRTNPNKKWDWYQIGGRWDGTLKLKGHDNKRDSALMELLDVSGMKEDERRRRAALVDKVISAFCKIVEESGASADEINAARSAHLAAVAAWCLLSDPRPRGKEFGAFLLAGENGAGAARYRDAVREAGIYFSVEPDEKPHATLAEWINEDVPAIQTFAILKDGKWMERGKMGLWACVSDENPGWDAVYAAEFATIRQDQWITVVDCHI